MRALQVLLVAITAVLMLENGAPRVEAAPQGKQSLSRVFKNSPGVRYTYSTQHGSSSANTNAVAAPATVQSTATGTQTRGTLPVTRRVRLIPVDHTPEVKKARKSFFSLYDKQARLAAEAPDNDLYGKQRYGERVVEASADDDEDDEHTLTVYYSEDDEEEEEDEDEDEDEEEDSEEGDEDEEEEDSDEEGDDSSSSEEDYDGDSSSSEEDGIDSSEEGGIDSSEEGGVDSSEEGEDSSSSSSSSSEEDGNYGLVWGVRGWTRQRLTPGALRLNLVTPKPVTDTLEVKQAKKKFFELYKTQAEMSFNAPDC